MRLRGRKLIVSVKIYGPYFRKDGRAHVIHYNLITKKRIVQSYPRYLMEQYLNRRLLDSEDVDHINNDCTDNRIENLQVISISKNREKQKLNTPPPKIYEFICPNCGQASKTLYRYYYHNQVIQGKKGPFCSNVCVGKTYHLSKAKQKELGIQY